MQEFGDGSITQNIAQRRPVGDPLRINQSNVFAIKQLDQPQLRIIGTRANKFCIQGYRRKFTDGFAQRGQRVVRGDHLIIQIVLS